MSLLNQKNYRGNATREKLYNLAWSVVNECNIKYRFKSDISKAQRHKEKSPLEVKSLFLLKWLCRLRIRKPWKVLIRNVKANLTTTIIFILLSPQVKRTKDINSIILRFLPLQFWPWRSFLDNFRSDYSPRMQKMCALNGWHFRWFSRVFGFQVLQLLCTWSWDK